MPTYTVHEPPAKSRAPEPERFVFVRDGFHFWAFLAAPVWMLLHRLWLSLLFYLLFGVGVSALLIALHAPPPLRIAFGFGLGLLVGLEAATLRRWTYARRRWNNVGVIVAEDEEEAERRFYAQWVAREESGPATATAPVFTTPVRRGPPDGTDVIGLFPEPEKPR